MKILELQDFAIKNGYNSVEFKFTNLKGIEKKCKWLDAYFGFFLIEGNDKFITVDQWITYTNDSFEFEIL